MAPTVFTTALPADDPEYRWADGRICDLLDSQVNAIEGACGQIASTDPKAVLSAAFDLIEAQIAQLGESDTAAPQAAETPVSRPSPFPTPPPARRPPLP